MSGKVWPWIVGALLGITVLKYAVVLVLVASDPSIAVEEDYYQRAVGWDDARAAQRASDALGWSAEIAVGPARPGSNRGEVRIRLLDDGALPITDATVHARLFHQGRAADPTVATVRTDAEGWVLIPIERGRRGLWRAELRVERGDSTFLLERTVIWGASR